MDKIVKLKEVPIPNDAHKVIFKRIEPLIEKYHKHQKIDLQFPGNTNQFGLNELLFSVYIQGLSDGNEATKNVKFKNK